MHIKEIFNYDSRSIGCHVSLFVGTTLTSFRNVLQFKSVFESQCNDVYNNCLGYELLL